MVRRPYTAPHPDERRRLRLLLDAYQEHSPDEQLPLGLAARVRAAGCVFVAVPCQRAVRVQKVATAAVTTCAALFNALTSYINGPELDSEERTERCARVAATVVPTIAARLDTQLAAEARDRERVSPHALEVLDAAAHMDSREPVLTGLIRGIVARSLATHENPGSEGRSSGGERFDAKSEPGDV